VERVGAFGRLSFRDRASYQPVSDTNPLDNENPFLDLHIAFSVGAKLPLAGVDPTRLQRATEGPD